jgi:hypothetical protein
MEGVYARLSGRVFGSLESPGALPDDDTSSSPPNPQTHREDLSPSTMDAEKWLDEQLNLTKSTEYKELQPSRRASGIDFNQYFQGQPTDFFDDLQTDDDPLQLGQLSDSAVPVQAPTNDLQSNVSAVHGSGLSVRAAGVHNANAPSDVSAVYHVNANARSGAPVQAPIDNAHSDVSAVYHVNANGVPVQTPVNNAQSDMSAVNGSGAPVRAAGVHYANAQIDVYDVNGDNSQSEVYGEGVPVDGVYYDEYGQAYYEDAPTQGDMYVQGDSEPVNNLDVALEEFPEVDSVPAVENLKPLVIENPTQDESFETKVVMHRQISSSPPRSQVVEPYETKQLSHFPVKNTQRESPHRQTSVSPPRSAIVESLETKHVTNSPVKDFNQESHRQVSNSPSRSIATFVDQDAALDRTSPSKSPKEIIPDSKHVDERNSQRSPSRSRESSPRPRFADRSVSPNSTRNGGHPKPSPDEEIASLTHSSGLKLSEEQIRELYSEAESLKHQYDEERANLLLQIKELKSKRFSSNPDVSEIYQIPFSELIAGAR